MSNLSDMERVDKVVDEIVDLQAKLRDDVESREQAVTRINRI